MILWVGHVAHTQEATNAYKILFGKLQGKTLEIH